MRSNLERVTKKFIRNLRMILARQYFMPPSSICKQPHCGYLRWVLLKDHINPLDLSLGNVLLTLGHHLSQLLVAGTAGAIWAYNKHRQRTNVHIMALDLIRGVPLTPKEQETMLDVLTPPASKGVESSTWWRKWLSRWCILLLQWWMIVLPCILALFVFRVDRLRRTDIKGKMPRSGPSLGIWSIRHFGRLCGSLLIFCMICLLCITRDKLG